MIKKGCIKSNSILAGVVVARRQRRTSEHQLFFLSEKSIVVILDLDEVHFLFLKGCVINHEEIEGLMLKKRCNCLQYVFDKQINLDVPIHNQIVANEKID